MSVLKFVQVGAIGIASILEKHMLLLHFDDLTLQVGVA